MASAAMAASRASAARSAPLYPVQAAASAARSRSGAKARPRVCSLGRQAQVVGEGGREGAGGSRGHWAGLVCQGAYMTRLMFVSKKQL